MISICVTVKNRSRIQADGRELTLFPNCVRSIVSSAASRSDVELVVSDWHSDDWPLSEWLAAAAGPIPVRIVPVEGAFSRGRGRNVAAEAASGDALLFLDADSIFCSRVLEAGLEYLGQGKAFFPIVYSFDGQEHVTGIWRRFGFGNCMVSRQMFRRSGGWPEFSRWGKEDDEFYARIFELADVVREDVPGFFHQWHPDDLAWKDAQSTPAAAAPASDAAAESREKLARARDQLAAVIPAGETLILVDENHFGPTLAPERVVLPFTERDNQYWGPPDNDAAAVAELQKLNQRGARWIVFAWPGLWIWHFYLGLQHYLQRTSRRAFWNGDLLVFKLPAGPPA